MKRMPKLSLVVPGLAPRFEKYNMLSEVTRQMKDYPETELLVDLDMGHVPIGTKMNGLIARARGRYIAGLGDDDMITPDYLASIHDAIDQHGTDIIVFQHEYYIDGERKALILEDKDYRHDYPADQEGLLYRRIDPKMPIRAEIIKKYRYPDRSQGEDQHFAEWFKRISACLTQHKIERVLYRYMYEPKQPFGCNWRLTHARD